MKKVFCASIFIIVLLVGFLGITYSIEIGDRENLKFDLIGPGTLYIDINNEYEEYGIKVTYNGKDISNKVIIDSKTVNTSLLGEYKVKYQVTIDGADEYVYRNVIVIDKERPVISLKGDEKIYLLLGGNYDENGYTADDNMDGDITKNVKVEGKADTKKEGTYTLEYSVTDTSGNTRTVVREIIVKKPIITLDNGDGNRVTASAYNAEKYSNTIIKNTWTNSGIYLEGYVKEKTSSYKIKLKNKTNSIEYTYNMTINRDNYYKGNLDLTTVKNGTYNVYIIAKSEDKLLNKLNNLSRIVRSKIGNKLITLSYENDAVKLVVSDFKYQYDIVIDPGHGGNENGANNGLIAEKTMNLIVSQYEKCRYEAMGYKVYMTRYDDTYGEMLGENDMDVLHRRALTIGYYGVVSKIVYSNHHNGSGNAYDHGFEMLVSNQATSQDLIIESSLYNKFKKIQNISDNGLRLYSRDYDSGNSYNKLSGTIYNNLNYYAIIRIPDQLFKVDVTIFEPIYLTSASDYNWYWGNANWIKMSEAKIEEYVNYLGGEYTADNKSCL